MEVTKFKGYPMLSFPDGPDDEYPFSFGAGKAKKLVKALKDHGVSEVLEAIIKLSGEKIGIEDLPE